MGKRRKACWHLALKSHSACSEGEHLACCFARFFYWLSWWSLLESQLCRSQFFHPIFSVHVAILGRYHGTQKSLLAPCSRHCALSLALSQTSAEPTFPWEASSKGICTSFHLDETGWRKLKTFLCMSRSVWSSNVCPCLAGPKTRSAGRP